MHLTAELQSTDASHGNRLRSTIDSRTIQTSGDKSTGECAGDREEIGTQLKTTRASRIT